MIQMQFEIPEENLPIFKEKMEKIIKVAKKIGLPEHEWPVYHVGDSFVKSIKITDDFDHETIELNKTHYYVTVQGEKIKINGWQFVASVDYEEENSQPIIKKISDLEIPEKYRSLGPDCEHCRKERNRKNLFILFNQDQNEFIQVGRSCMKDFLGHPSPDHIAAFSEMLLEISEGGFCSSEGFNYYEPGALTLLAYVSSSIRQFGWIPRSKANPDIGRYSTATIALNQLNDNILAAKRHEPSKFPKPKEIDWENAKAALTWAIGLLEENRKLSEYEFNLQSACSRLTIGKNAGLIASALPTWARIKEQELAGNKSEFVGQIKERLKDLILTVYKVIPPSDFSPYPSYKILMHDESGNIFFWQSSKGNINLGQVYKLTGTVKAHNLYKEKIKQTVLSHCKFEEILFNHEELT